MVSCLHPNPSPSIRPFIHAFRFQTGAKPSKGLREFLSALRNIDKVVPLGINTEHVGNEEIHACFSAFPETLTALALQLSTTLFSMFVVLLSYFPNVTSLRVG